MKLFFLGYFFSFSLLFGNDYLFKRGFLYSWEEPYYVPENYSRVNKHLWIEKTSTFTQSSDAACVVLGFCVDVLDPSLDLQAISNRLSEELEYSPEAFFSYVENLCGRYVIFFKTLDGIQLITDPVAFRPVFYNKNATLIAGHAKLLSLNVNKDLDALNIDERRFYQGREEFTAEKGTQFKGVYQLNPNFLLELSSGKMVRIFPHAENSFASKEEMKKELTFYVGNAIEGMLKHYKKPPLMSLTSGYDSRTTFSILRARGITIEEYFSYLLPDYKESIEAQLPKDLCRRFGFKHCTIFTFGPSECSDEDLKRALKLNCQYKFRDLTDDMVINLWKAFSSDQYVHVNSNVIEIWKPFNLSPKKSRDFMPEFENLADMLLLFQEDIFNHDIGSFVHWESQLSRWMTDVWVLTDVVFDTFCPYNSRRVISLMLKMPSEDFDALDVQKELIEELLINEDARSLLD